MGDRIIPLGMKGQQKISDLLIQIKVPLYKKQDVLVLESNGKIAWVVGLRVSEEFKITPKTERILAVESV
jgi:tRNA(Ile)-lysidine synthase